MEDYGMDAEQLCQSWRIPDGLWKCMSSLLPKYRRSPKGGRPRNDLRQIANGIYYVLRTGCQWKAVPSEFGSGSTLHRYFQEWASLGLFRKSWASCLRRYDKRRCIQWAWQSVDCSTAKAPLGGEKNRAKSHGSRQVGR